MYSLAAAEESTHARVDQAWDYVDRSRRCAELRRHDQWGASHEPDAPRSPMNESTAESLRPGCAGVVFDWREVGRQLKVAAELGSPEARLVYAQNPYLAPQHAAADLVEWRDWREHAPLYLEEAVARGNGEAAMLTGLASMSRECSMVGGQPSVCMRTFPLNAILPRDDVIAYAHLLLAHRFGVGSDAAELDVWLLRLAARLTPEQQAEAARIAAQNVALQGR